MSKLKKRTCNIKEAEEIFDDEDECYEVKQLIKSYIIPDTQSLDTYKYKMFGMNPEEYEKEFPSKKPKKRMSFTSMISQAQNQVDQNQLNALNGGTDSDRF